MDPIAHTLFGAAMAEAGLKRKTARPLLRHGVAIVDLDQNRRVRTVQGL